MAVPEDFVFCRSKDIAIAPIFVMHVFESVKDSGELTRELHCRTAIQTGFSFFWAGAQWLYPYFRPQAQGLARLELGAMLPVNLFVTFLVLTLGAVALIIGLRRRYPAYCGFLGHTRFANYFMITIFPMQARVLGWTWDHLIAIALFAVPVWLVLHFGLMPVRNRK